MVNITVILVYTWSYMHSHKVTLIQISHLMIKLKEKLKKG